MSGLGPIPFSVLALFFAMFVAWTVARLFAKRQKESSFKKAGDKVLDTIAIGFLSARVVYIAIWWSEYSASPRSILAISDGGFSWVGGVVGSAIYLFVRTRKQTQLRKPVIFGIISGAFALNIGLYLQSVNPDNAPRLPTTVFSDSDGGPVTLSDIQKRPVVVNLWATWCPPCRREMPAFRRAEEAFPEVKFVMLNQGESQAVVFKFLEKEKLEFEHMVLDRGSLLMREARISGLPTTLFFDSEGRLMDRHMGEFTLPALYDSLRRNFNITAQAAEKEQP